jgi:hypothetical protein
MNNALAVVADNTGRITNTRVLVSTPTGARQVSAAEADVTVPLISLILSDAYRPRGVIDTNSQYGIQPAAELTYIWRGEKKRLVGALLPLVDGPDLVLPLGTLV